MKQPFRGAGIYARQVCGEEKPGLNIMFLTGLTIMDLTPRGAD